MCPVGASVGLQGQIGALDRQIAELRRKRRVLAIQRKFEEIKADPVAYAAFCESRRRGAASRKNKLPEMTPDQYRAYRYLSAYVGMSRQDALDVIFAHERFPAAKRSQSLAASGSTDTHTAAAAPVSAPRSDRRTLSPGRG